MRVDRYRSTTTTIGVTVYRGFYRARPIGWTNLPVSYVATDVAADWVGWAAEGEEEEKEEVGESKRRPVAGQFSLSFPRTPFAKR